MPFYPRNKNRIIEYPESPNGYAFIGKYQPPFIPTENGHGFFGVLIMDKEKDLVQCHICGEWHEILSTHIWAKHRLKANDYRMKFGLLKDTALINNRIRLQRSATMKKLREDYPDKCRRKFKKGNKESGNRAGWKKPQEVKNRYGCCFDQLIYKVKIAEQKLGRTPTTVELQKIYGGGFIAHIYNVFGGYMNLCKMIGLTPQPSSFNPKYSKEFLLKLLQNFKKEYGREPLCTDGRRGLIPDATHFYRYFGKGGFSKAKKMAGVED